MDAKTRTQIIFVVGNSRMGTHLMSRILGNHEDVYDFPHEIHFFEELWCVSDEAHKLDRNAAVDLAAKLLSIQYDGYFAQNVSDQYTEEARAFIGPVSNEGLTSLTVYERFLYHCTKANNKSIACEHTPRNLFYISEILGLLPNSKVVNMIRDPRDVLLSQKRKWRRRFLGAKNIPLREAIRSYINYHPITISMLWNSSVRMADKTNRDPRFISIRFEDVTNTPEQTVQGACRFLGLSYNAKMLDIPLVGSSTEIDSPEEKGIRKRAESWKSGGLNNTEIYLCQKITGKLMENHGYTRTIAKSNFLSLLYLMLTWPLKLSLAFAINLGRTKNIAQTIRKRLS